MISDSKEIHWFYTGKWKYFNDRGELTETKIYDKGILIE
jgi:hypothetical protein